MKTRINVVLFLALLFLLGAMLALPVGSGQAAPPAAPTPITSPGYSPDGNYYSAWSSQAVATSTTSEVLPLASFEQADFQYAIDQGDVNTTTLTVKYSNDRVNWVTGPALVSSNAADAGDLTRLPLFGRYTRIDATLTNTYPVTITVNLLAK